MATNLDLSLTTEPTNNRPLYTVDAPHPCTAKSVHQPCLDKFEQLRGIVTTHFQLSSRQARTPDSEYLLVSVLAQLHYIQFLTQALFRSASSLSCFMACCDGRVDVHAT